MLPLLVLHLIAEGPSYGNQLMERIAGMTEGVLSVNPNTMYPLLRGLERRGLIEGSGSTPSGGPGATTRSPDRAARSTSGCVEEVRPFLDSVRSNRRDRARGVRRVRLAGARAAVVLEPERRSGCGRTRTAGRPSWRASAAWWRSTPDWPEAGAKVVWESSPGGRGRVTEKVTGARRRRLATQVFEDALAGTQTFAVPSPARRRAAAWS